MNSLDNLYNQLTIPGISLIEDMRQIKGDILILGGGGKIGATLAILARRAIEEAGLEKRVIVASRFEYTDAQARIQAAGAETIEIDLFDSRALASLPQAENIIFMAGRKFGTSDDMSLTWMINVILPARIAEAFPKSKILVFSTGNVYGYRRIASGGALEHESLEPIGEYAQTCVGRERVMSAYSQSNGTPMLFFRLNYAIDMQYGVLHDIAQAVADGTTVDLSASCFNCIWQGDAAAYALRLINHAATPPAVFNVTGPEIISIRWAAEQLARSMESETPPVFCGEEKESALISNSAKLYGLLGYPTVTLSEMLDWTSQWIREKMPAIQAPTHFEEITGRF